ncbi:M3 family oligoendopeptidase [Brumimicrobium glaciale]|uniref:M3 family oligoendopeptidase n=1 Tax=Brumimicrobium glaciale TaxID=200475 RepID=A0A4Q4KGI6_9FLAO|nr:M3 family oligoendopeptidase [Brumimicrobium glaciale]RYM32313.1 M3 family oligoendopeptidase [Brumimicrobium glaciale]
MKVTRPKRTFLPDNFIIDQWKNVEPFFIDLENRSIDTKAEFEKWISDQSELEAVVSEDLAWRYIKMTIDTKDKELADAYAFFVKEIQPHLEPYSFRLNKKLSASPFKSEFKDEAYKIYFRGVDTAIKLFREENIPLNMELAEKSQIHGAVSGAQSIEHGGEKITMQKASSLLKENDEALRKSIFDKMATRRAEDTEQLDDLFTELIQLRHKVATNAGYDNFRDYMFDELGRFDYTKEDCFDFHQSIKEEIVPLVKQISQKKAELMGKEQLKPWDSQVDPLGRAPLKPFKDGKELLDKTIVIFDKIDTYFGDCLRTMDAMGYLDLDSKDGKSPGGYNYPLYEIGVPFIFMNSVGSQRDLITMIHEGGHAIQSFLTRDLALTSFKSFPSEVAELASMSMELLTMDYWDEFYDNEEDLTRAKIEQLETVLEVLPWVATIDEFQHWIYENPTHSKEERKTKWISLLDEYGTGTTDWTGYEDVRAYSWQRQLHLFEVPFYYIEYGMAQLGALAIWKNSKEDFEKTIQDYKKALALGYTKSIPGVYEEANITFDFSKKNIKELAEFVGGELVIHIR